MKRLLTLGIVTLIGSLSLHAQTKYQINWGESYYQVTMDSTFFQVKYTTIDLQFNGEPGMTTTLKSISDSLEKESNDQAFKLTFRTTEGNEMIRLIDDKGITGYLWGEFEDKALVDFLFDTRRNSSSRMAIDSTILLDTVYAQIKIEPLDYVDISTLLAENQNTVYKDEVGTFTLIQKHAMVQSYSTTTQRAKWYKFFDKKWWHPDVSMDTTAHSQIDIEEIRIRIVDGFIVDIFAETPNHDLYFLDRSSSQTLFRFHENISGLVLYSTKDSQKFIRLDEILAFKPERCIGYKPNDEIVTLERADETKTVMQSYSLNSILDARVYTDFKSLINNAPNGLLNIEISSEIPFNLYNYGSVHYFAYITPNIRISRFDNAQKLVVNNGTNASGLSILQQSKLSAGFDLNLMKTLAYSGKNKFSLDIGIAYLNTALFDTTETSIESDYNSLQWGLRPKLKINLNRRFWLDLSGDVGMLFPTGNTSISGFTSNTWYGGLDVELSFQPNPDNNDGFYLKYGIMDDLNASYGDYSYIQVGYRVSLSNAYRSMTNSPDIPNEGNSDFRAYR